MEVLINNQPVFLEENTSLHTLLLQKELAEKKGIAVAVNNKVVARAAWSVYPLYPNDKVVIIHATQGG
ncbi:sulfur carrier protein ThiS [Paraflavisolibacter sp. H34]|uniref:sulfur carrier protein ThiS n=1 Tax=Huijunlia imazamoxiresistens TaxID=3127457 RepID=UPI0030158C9E